ncbi:MAG: formylglycine-generating enzyme family protein [Kiritimatiellia bacterium]
MKATKAAAVLTVAVVTMVMFVSVSTMAANPTIDGVMVQQRWPWSRLVDIDYVLKCDLGQAMDIVVSAYNGSIPLDVPKTSFSGDLYGVSCGARRIVWDPMQTAYTNNGVLPEFRVALAPTPTPLYMIVDLTKSVGEAGQTEYVYESDLTNGLWGAWVRNPVTNRETAVESVIWTGVTTNDSYKTDKLVLRRIPAGAFEMGPASIYFPALVPVTLSRDFYAGVYEVTQDQWLKVMGTNPSEFQDSLLNPVENVSYDNIRGAAALSGGGWPTNVNVYGESFVGRLRLKTGLEGFDLPTDAQWEYACRAGTTTFYNDGISGSSTNQLNELGWWSGNSGSLAYTNGLPHTGGQKAPNAWGLYDMHGNMSEWCLDWHGHSVQGGEDPAGPLPGKERVRRGGNWSADAEACSSAFRSSRRQTGKSNYLGFRLVRSLP